MLVLKTTLALYIWRTKQTPARHLAHFFLNLISFKEPQNLKTVKESRNKVEYTGLLWMVIKGDIDGLVCYKPAVDSLFSNIYQTLFWDLSQTHST